jgi:nucleoside-diphosphate-sugar epimerase
MAEWRIYGGAGFIGQHLAYSVLSNYPQDRVNLLDIRTLCEAGSKAPLKPFLETGRLYFEKTDVRNMDQLHTGAKPFDVVVNLAAVHREPGHRPEEYFDTNVAGAENICRLAESTGCCEIIFTSSISVYGVNNRAVDEHSEVQPRTPYGQSKHQAELIHRQWAKQTGGRLSIIRPGVVFGPGEAGNVARLLSETLKRRRALQIRPDQPKAGIYIEELLEVIHWLRKQPLQQGGYQLVNGVSNEQLTFNAYGKALQKSGVVSGKPLTVPEPLLKLAINLLNPLARVLAPGSKIHPQRLAKLMLANDVRPSNLTAMGYPYAWPLNRALADWLDKGL